MASNPTSNGSTPAAAALTPAQRLMAQHAAQEAHNPTVEEVPDEEFVAHPPPSAAAPESKPVSADSPRANPPSAPGPAETTLSAKAAGKQPAQEPAQASTPRMPRLDTQSEEAFPALGAPKARSAAAPTPWSQKPATVGKAVNGSANGLANGHPPASAKSSSATTPLSGIVTPSSTAPSQRGPTPQMSLPGRYKESITLHRSIMTPRNELKKPVSDILRDINKRSKATIEMKSGPGGTIVFEGTGPVDDVRVTLKEVANQLCSKQNLKVPVPSSVRGKIVGKQGVTIQAISKKTGARINISKQEAAEILEDEDLDTTVDVTIEGDPFAVQMAKQEIEKIVNEHTSSVNTRLKHIAPEYYAFLNDAPNPQLQALQQSRDLKMQIPRYQSWHPQSPPQVPPNRQPATFSPLPHLPIQLSGDRQAVAEAKAEIDRQVAQLQKQLTSHQEPIERGRHQFIVGDKGTSLRDFMRETGCSVILPPDSDDSEMITVVGPPERIEDALNKLMDLASSMSMASADIAKQHAQAPRGAQAHARDVTRYLQQRQALQQLEALHSAKIVPEESGNWQIYAKEGKNAMKARADVLNLIAGHPPTRFHPVQVDPFYHDHLRQQIARQVRDQYGVHVVVPEESTEDSPVLLVFEDRVAPPQYELPRKQPSVQEAQAFQQALREAQQHILDLVGAQQNIVSREVEAPVKFHDKIRRHVDRHHQALPSDQIPLQVKYGGQQSQGVPRGVAPRLNLRGPQDSVDVLMQSLLSFIEQEKQDELERGFTLSFDFPQKFANHLIGRKGEHINRVREEFDVDIQLNDGKCEVKGPEAKANACKKHIIDMVKKLEDEATHHLNIPQQFHRDLIGPQGSQVNRLQERYGVRVNFPRTRQAGEDDVSEAGDARRNNQAPNEVIVKGPSRGADGCRDELLSLLQYVKDHSFTNTVSVAQSQLPSLIGSGGKEMEALRLETGAQIDVPSARDAPSASGRAEIKLKGSKQAVEAAKKLIEDKAKVFDNTTTRTLDVDRKHHRVIIGGQGANLRNIIIQAGGPDEPRLHNRMVRFPKTDAEGSGIRIEGHKDVVDKICAAIEATVRDQESQKTDIAEVKPEKHRLLIGRNGETRRQLEQQFNVTLNVPRQTETGPSRSQVKISGQPDAVEKAKAHILEMTKEQEGETVGVPRRLHHSISDNGQFFRRLRNDHRVTVDHAGQRPPPRPAAGGPARTNGATPLITDDPASSANAHSWESRDMHSSAEEGEIPWVLSGPTVEAVAAAKAKLARALEEAGKQDTVGFLILPDPRVHRHVIGPAGAEINRIRKQTGTKIQVPKDQSKGEAIEITGAKDKVEEARDIILGIARNNA